MRPISGWTGAGISVVGGNLIDDTLRKVQSDVIYIGATTSDYTIFLPAGTYTFSAEMRNGADYGAYIRGSTQSSIAFWTAGTHTTSGTVTLTKADLYRVNFYAAGIDGSNVGNCKLEYGSVATAYTPYSGSTVSVTFPEGMGTVYGGTVDAVSGLLTITHYKYVFDGTEDGWSLNNPGGSYIPYYLIGIRDDSAINECICSHLEKQTISVNTDLVGCNVVYSTKISQNAFFLRLPNTIVSRTDLDAFKTWLNGQYANGTPLTLVGMLTTPETYQLTRQTIRALRGINNIWTDVNGTIELKYWDTIR
jgi:hypothetical protein